MPGRSIPIVTGEVYHIYNRGSEKRDIFTQKRDYKRFQKTFYYYHFSGRKPSFSRFAKCQLMSYQPDPGQKLVEIMCYCLMPNHFHFLIKQLRDGGVSFFASQLANSYTKYFNTKYKRVGPLFQGAFKAVIVETDEQFAHLSRYIHLNPIVSGITKHINNYQWSSYCEYLTEKSVYCSLEGILSLFPSTKDYQMFVEEQIGYGTSLEILKHSLLEEV